MVQLTPGLSRTGGLRGNGASTVVSDGTPVIVTVWVLPPHSIVKAMGSVTLSCSSMGEQARGRGVRVGR